MASLLKRPFGELSIKQIKALTNLVEAKSQALEPKVTADTILQGFKKLAGSIIELTLPIGVSIQEAGKILNATARDKGMSYPLFYEGDKKFWSKNQANAKLKTVPGQTYRFKIQTGSAKKTKAEQVNAYGKGVPIGAVVLAEACMQLATKNEETLFKDADGNKIWLRGSAPGIVLRSCLVGGTNAKFLRLDRKSDVLLDNLRLPHIFLASLALPENKKLER